MAKQTINIGSSVNKGDGDPLRTAFDKINDNFAEIYEDVSTLEKATGTDSGGTLVVNAIQGSVIGEDSTVIVDASTSTVDAGRLTGTLPALDGSALTGVTVSSIAFADVSGKPTTIAGYGITDALALGTTSTTALAGDTALFDGVFASLTSKPTTLAGYGITDALALGTSSTTALAGDTALFSGAFADLTSKPTTIAGYGITDALELGTTSTTALAGDTALFDGAFASLTSKPTTIAGYGITDALALGTTSTTALAGDTALFDSTTSEVAIGSGSGETSQSADSVAIGTDAGKTSQGGYAVAIGRKAGQISQSAGTVAIGRGAGYSAQGLSGIAIGYLAGEVNQGGGAIAIGANAGTSNQAADSIILNASNTALENTQTGSFVVKPVRNASGTHQLEYDPATGEVTYDTLGGGGSSLQSRIIRTNTTSSLADGAEADLDITGFKAYALMAITTDRAARVRLYVKGASRTADASRAEGVDPTSDAGLIAEVITTGAETVIISPGAYGFNLEPITTTNIACRVTNKSGSTDTVQVSLLILQLEA